MPKPSQSDSPQPRILVIDENALRVSVLVDGLKEAGFTDYVVLDKVDGLLNRVYEIDPDVIVIDLENPSRDVLEQLFSMSRLVRRPIAMFVGEGGASSMEAAVDAGVSAYVVNGLAQERLRPIIEMAILRFRAFNRMQSELEQTRSELEGRKLIDKAKRLLMKHKKMSEEEAYAALRRVAMNSNKRMIDVAESVVTALFIDEM